MRAIHGEHFNDYMEGSDLETYRIFWKLHCSQAEEQI
jgi:hypothetical protein